MLFGSLWRQKIRVQHLILDNGTTHAPSLLAQDRQAADPCVSA
jgi:hypothetical protein